MEFTAAAPAYSFTVQTGAVFTITGGIINNSSFAPAFTVNAGSALTVGDGAFVEIGSLAGGGTVTIGPSSPFSLLSIVGNGGTTFSGKFSGAGSMELDNTDSLTLTGASFGGNIGSIGGDLTLCGFCAGPALTISGGSFTVGGSTIVDAGTLTVTNGGTLTTTNFGVAGSAVITGAGSSVTVTGQTIIGNFAPASVIISNGGVLNSQGSADIATFQPFLGTPTVTVTGPGSTWNVGGPFGLFVGDTSVGPGALTIANGGVVNSTTSTIIGDVSGSSSVMVTGTGSVLNAFNSLAIGGPGCGCTSPGIGTLTIADGGVVNSPGGTSIGAGSTLNLGTGGLAGAIVTPAIANDGQIVANFTDTLTLAAAISGAGTLSKAGPGTLILTGASTYTGATTIDGGTLIVNGSIANSPVTVNAGATLAGTGTVGPTTINSGGIFAPGNSPGTMTVAGNLAFQSGALYLVQIDPSTASRANVSGSATLAGTVQAVFAPGSYLSHRYTILSAAGGRSGTFNTLTTTNLPAGFSASLSYTASDATLNIIAALGGLSILGGPDALLGNGLNGNQRNVANALNAFFNNGGTLPPAFVPIFGLTGANLANALTLLSGEPATGAQQGAFQLTNQFLGIMLDPFVEGRNAFDGGSAIGFAPEREELPDDIALAYAKLLKAPPKPPTFEQRWSVWGAGYGASNRTSGDLAVVGSHDFAARTTGGTAGLDYHLSRDSVIGFALGGGGTNWSLSQGLGGGKSDAFQAGVYGATRWGPAYLAGTLAFTNHWMSTDRFAFAGDHLTASFNAQSYGGRVESGYRFATIYGGLTPYAAIQAQSFHTPFYNESDLNAGGFGLAFNSRNATDTRTELGARFDRLLLLNPEAALTLRARVAWAHDRVSDPSLAPVFQALPGASFVVNGATPAKNSALTRRRASPRQRRCIAREVRRRIRRAFHNLRRHRDAAIYVVGEDARRAFPSMLRQISVSHVRVAAFIVNNNPKTMDRSRRSFSATAGRFRMEQAGMLSIGFVSPECTVRPRPSC
ncbi:MAG: autotransporter domain-containing protein [Hyphomicrobiales bacterium]|nr:autotransporter domain-containing protein [Hyphomicrobiales bacterium]